MANDDRPNDKRETGGEKDSDLESRGGWKSEWVDTNTPSADKSLGAEEKGRHAIPPEEKTRG